MTNPSRSKTAFALCVCGLSAVAMTAYARTVERLATGFNGTRDAFLDKISLEPTEATPFHYHPGDAVNIVMQGAVTLTNRCGDPQTFLAGDFFVERADVVHQLTNDGAETAVFYAEVVGPGLGVVGFAEPPNCDIDAALQSGGMGFGDQALQTRRTRSLRLRNTGTVALPIVSVDVSGRNKRLFRSRDNCGTLIPVGGSCLVSVTFSSPTLGDKSAELRVETGDHIVFTRELTGRGVPAWSP